jgi:hypothetical protein
MVTDQQVRRLMKLNMTEKTKSATAAKAGMDEKTARKYYNGLTDSDQKGSQFKVYLLTINQGGHT